MSDDSPEHKTRPDDNASEEHREFPAEDGSSAPYQDGAFYDHRYLKRKEDLNFYLRLIERVQADSVLELGVGTGRIATKIAEQGIRIAGVDRMRTMLQRAEERIAQKPAQVQGRLSLHQGDLRSIRLEEKFALVLAPFNVLMHLYRREDFERAMTTVRHHLASSGRFAFDVRMPDFVELNRNPDKIYRSRDVTHPETKHRFHYRERFDYDAVRQIQLVATSLQREDSPSVHISAPLTHRQFFPAELEALLHYNGFELEERYGNFDEDALDNYAESQVIVARQRADWAPA
ncbi:MAG: class I SAM-dependent methyltransferase [Myxococcota bacterium]